MIGKYTCPDCGAKLRRKGAKHDCASHMGQAAVLWQRSLALSGEPLVAADDGLIWKVACKSGTLALSPGPGQTDSEKPLVLTGELFRDMQLSLKEKAFPYCTVPETHNNGSLENTGYVEDSDVLTRDELLADSRIPEAAKIKAGIQNDPPETEYLLAGIRFTEPDAKQKALNGSIPDTSIGVKFGYRNKRTGNTYRAAWEHLALTPVPWVDGLVPFGLSQDGPFDQAAVPDSIEVYLEAPVRRGFDLSVGILPAKRNADTLRPNPNPSSSEDKDNTMPQRTVEDILAAEQAAREAAEARVAALEGQLALSQTTITTLAEKDHQATVSSKVRALNGKVPPAILLAAKKIWLEDKPGASADAQGMNLSVTAEGAEQPTEITSATDVVDFLLSAFPTPDAHGVVQLAAIHENIDTLALAQGDAAKSDAEIAAEQVANWRKEQGVDDQPISA